MPSGGSRPLHHERTSEYYTLTTQMSLSACEGTWILPSRFAKRLPKVCLREIGGGTPSRRPYVTGHSRLFAMDEADRLATIRTYREGLNAPFDQQASRTRCEAHSTLQPINSVEGRRSRALVLTFGPVRPRQQGPRQSSASACLAFRHRHSRTRGT